MYDGSIGRDGGLADDWLTSIGNNDDDRDGINDADDENPVVVSADVNEDEEFGSWPHIFRYFAADDEKRSNCSCFWWIRFHRFYLYIHTDFHFQ